jgi:cell division protein FtsQ
VLHITITEKEPIARVFTVSGHSFYLDSAANRMPLSEKLSARLPVFTGFTDAQKLNKNDSNLLKEVTVVANYILKDSFWMAQVAQLDITPERNFEMIPLVGNHIVKLGNGQNVDMKFRRLMVFYRQVLSKTGFDKYKIIDVQYAGQVVVSKNEGIEKVDAAQLKNNIEKLIKQSPSADTAMRVIKPIAPLEADDEIPTDETLKDNNALNPAQQNPNTMKLSLPATDNDGKKKREAERKTPKAVMPKRTTAATANGDRGYN